MYKCIVSNVHSSRLVLVFSQDVNYWLNNGSDDIWLSLLNIVCIRCCMIYFNRKKVRNKNKTKK